MLPAGEGEGVVDGVVGRKRRGVWEEDGRWERIEGGRGVRDGWELKAERSVRDNIMVARVARRRRTDLLVVCFSLLEVGDSAEVHGRPVTERRDSRPRRSGEAASTSDSGQHAKQEDEDDEEK